MSQLLWISSCDEHTLAVQMAVETVPSVGCTLGHGRHLIQHGVDEKIFIVDLSGSKIAPSSKYKFVRDVVVSKDFIPSPPKKPRTEHYEEIRRPVPKPFYKAPESKHAYPVKAAVKKPAFQAAAKDMSSLEPLPQRKKPMPMKPAPEVQHPTKSVYTAPAKLVKQPEKRQEAKEVNDGAEDSGSEDARAQAARRRPRHRAGVKSNRGTRLPDGTRTARTKRRPRDPATDLPPESSKPTVKPKTDAQHELNSVMSSILHDELQQIMIKKLAAHIKVSFEEKYGKDTEVATVQQLIELLDEKIRVKEVQNPEPPSTQVTQVEPVAVLPSEKSSTTVEPPDIITCTYCRISTHTLNNCTEFLKMSVKHRKLWAKMSGVCFKCLQLHFPRDCTYTNCCAQCNSSLHNSLLCDAETKVAAVQQSIEPHVQIIICSYCKDPTHALNQCEQFFQMAAIVRRKWAITSGVCFKCLLPHKVRDCTCTDVCSHCNSPMHNSLLCDAETDVATGQYEKINRCSYCGNPTHALYQCAQFIPMPVIDRRNWAKTSGLCFKCFEPHFVRDCTCTDCCIHCNSPMHNSLLCDAEAEMPSVQHQETKSCLYCGNPTHVLYQCAQFNQMTVIDRRHWAKTSGLCFKCFDTHFVRDCTCTDVCSHCNSPMHNSLLCDAETNVATGQYEKINRCSYCGNPTHALYQCAQFIPMPVMDRRNWAKTSGLCFKCFEPHFVRDCTCTDCCSHCNSPMHNSLLCDAEAEMPSVQHQETKSCLYCGNPTHVLYQCAQFNQMTVIDRRHWAKTSGLCFKCFDTHFVRDCTCTDVCSHCNSPMHNSLLCDAETNVATGQYEKINRCSYCGNPTHALYQCAQFITMPVMDRRNWAKTSGLCFKCFEPHFVRDCTCTDCCSHCNSPMHNSLLCDAEAEMPSVQHQETKSCLYCGNPTHVLYQCAQFNQMTVIDRRHWAKTSGLCFKCFDTHFVRDCTCADCCSLCNSPMHNSLLCDAETNVATGQYEKINRCSYCGNPTHALYQCAQFIPMPVMDRRNWAKTSGLCFKCFEPHFVRDCTCTDCCSHCNSPMHNSLLCDAEAETPSVQHQETKSCLYCGNPTHVLYQCAQFNQMTVIDRRHWAKTSGLCFKCFDTHFVRDCTCTDVCSHCNSPMHNSLLCDAETNVATGQYEKINRCSYCGNPTHALYQCAQFIPMPVMDRRNWAKTSGLCFKCFEPHFVRDCTCTDCCSHCNSPMHNSLLCDAEAEMPSVQHQETKSCLYCGNPTHVLYQCAQFNQMTVIDRRHWAKTSGLCFKCFDTHFVRDCTCTDVCSHCNSPMHNSLLCDAETNVATGQYEKINRCSYCGNPTHALYQCAQFIPMPVMDRRNWAKTSGLCFKCFEPHFVRDCTCTDCCSHCNSPMHNSLLCDAEAEMPSVQHQETKSCLYCGNPTHVLYQCAQFNQMTVIDRRHWAKTAGLCFKCFDPHFVRDCTCADCCSLCNSPMHNSLLCDAEAEMETVQGEKTMSCLYCGNPTHVLYQCAQFNQMTVIDRRHWAKASGLCFKCFDPHFVRDCTCTDCCSHCNSPMHNSLLCDAEAEMTSTQHEETMSCLYCGNPSHVLYQCAQFNQMTVIDRRHWTKTSGLCFKCFDLHYVRDCTCTDCCSHCNSSMHNSLLCDAEAETASVEQEETMSCLYCGNPTHVLYQCAQFNQMTVKERRLWTKTSRLCFKCFEPHYVRDCTCTDVCSHCNSPMHNSLLCDAEAETASVEQEETMSCLYCGNPTHVLYQCAQFNQMTVKERRLWTKTSRHCFKCFEPHYTRDCTYTDNCTNCDSRRHNSLLCHGKAAIGSEINSSVGGEIIRCSYCTKEGHILNKCGLFVGKFVLKRRTWAAKRRICFKCLRVQCTRDCTSYFCKRCGSLKHHSLLCDVKTFVFSSVKEGCSYCKEADHTLHKCSWFLQLKPQKRSSWASKTTICVKCLREHCNRDCTIPRCGHCNSLQHNSIFCYLASEKNSSDNARTIGCPYCKKAEHTLLKCAQFLQETVKKRSKFVKKSNVCRKCLEHCNRDCTSPCCSHCNSPKHNSLLCMTQMRSEAEQQSTKLIDEKVQDTSAETPSSKVAETKTITLSSDTNSSTVETSCCPWCIDQAHTLCKCEHFLQKTVKDRRLWVKKSGFCFKCLGKHYARHCSCTDCCSQCNSDKHHVLMCDAKSELCDAENIVALETNSSVSTEIVGCSFCEEADHTLEKCTGFFQLSTRKRRSWTSQSSLCFSCLQVHCNCTTPRCRHCNSPKHNSILCNLAVAPETNSSVNTEIIGCLYCKKPEHTLHECTQFTQLTVKKRNTFAWKLSLCLKCFEYCNRDCPTPCCSHCNSPKHNSLLCNTQMKRAAEQQSTKLIDERVQDTSAETASSEVVETKTIALSSDANSSTVETSCCPCCMDQAHTLCKCKQFLQKTVKDKRVWVKKSGFCFKCLGKHYVRQCSCTDCCSQCNSDKHHSLLCDAKTDVSVQNAEKAQVKDTLANVTPSSPSSEVPEAAVASTI